MLIPQGYTLTVVDTDSIVVLELDLSDYNLEKGIAQSVVCWEINQAIEQAEARRV